MYWLIALLVALAVIGWFVAQSLFEPGRRRRVLAALDGSRAWMSRREIADRSGVRTVSVLLNRMEDDRLVERQERRTDGSLGVPSVSFYRLTDLGRRARTAWQAIDVN